MVRESPPLLWLDTTMQDTSHMLPKQVVQVPPPFPLRWGFPHHASIPVIFEKFQTQILAWRENPHQLKNNDD